MGFEAAPGEVNWNGSAPVAGLWDPARLTQDDQAKLHTSGGSLGGLHFEDGYSHPGKGPLPAGWTQSIGVKNDPNGLGHCSG